MADRKKRDDKKTGYKGVPYQRPKGWVARGAAFLFAVVFAVCICIAPGESQGIEKARAKEEPPVQAEDGTTAVIEEKIPDDLGSLYAKSAVLMDADSQRVLISKDGGTMRPMASTTKIMTCILALEEGNMEDVVTASGKAASQPKVHLGMREGEQFILKDLLHSLMLESHNDSAYAIAEHIAGSVPEFADKMNAKAKEIGCENAHFVTPNGLDGTDEGGTHSISAADLAKIMSYCIAKSPKSEEFLAITQTRQYGFSDVSGKRNFSCTNHNQFLDMMEGALSGKTGFTGDAGYCYVGALRKDGKTFVVALLACGWPNNKSYKWADTKKLMAYALENYEYRDVYIKPETSPIPVLEGITADGQLFEEVNVQVIEGTKEDTFNVLLREDEEVTVEVTEKDWLCAPVAKGESVGSVRYSLEGRVIREDPLVTAEEIKERTVQWVGKKLTEIYLKFRLWNK